MKPSRPWLMPISGIPKGASSRAMPSIVPSPPSTTATSAFLPIACTVCGSNSLSPRCSAVVSSNSTLPASRLHDAGNRQQRLADAFRAGLAEERDVPEGLGHASIMQDAVMAARPSGAASGLKQPS